MGSGDVSKVRQVDIPLLSQGILRTKTDLAKCRHEVYSDTGIKKTTFPFSSW